MTRVCIFVPLSLYLNLDSNSVAQTPFFVIIYIFLGGRTIGGCKISNLEVRNSSVKMSNK
jgi:hypothetical protein